MDSDEPAWMTAVFWVLIGTAGASILLSLLVAAAWVGRGMGMW
jgi:hypothetical protein